jgi:hypothetical protein
MHESSGSLHIHLGGLSQGGSIVFILILIGILV